MEADVSIETCSKSPVNFRDKQLACDLGILVPVAQIAFAEYQLSFASLVLTKAPVCGALLPLVATNLFSVPILSFTTQIMWYNLEAMGS